MQNGMIMVFNRCDIMCVIEVMIKLWVCCVLPFRHVIVLLAVGICVI